jgi:hypothetical protein
LRAERDATKQSSGKSVDCFASLAMTIDFGIRQAVLTGSPRNAHAFSCFPEVSGA